MLIVCTNCATSYQVAPSSLGSTGRSVRCVRCGQVWFAANTESLAAIAESHRADMAALTAIAPDRAAASAPPPEEYAIAEVHAAEPPPDTASDLALSDTGADATPALTDPDGGPPQKADLSSPQEPQAISDEPVFVSVEGPQAAPQTDIGPPLEDIETVAARRARRLAAQRRRFQQPSLMTMVLALVAINIALIGWRADVVRRLPQTASLYAAIRLPVNLRGLVFTDVATEKESHEGVQVLVVEGAIVNTGRRAVEVPRLRFAVRDGSGHEVYTWTALPTKNVLAPGETLPFRSRLASPPREGNQVLVRFFNRRDLVAGLQ